MATPVLLAVDAATADLTADDRFLATALAEHGFDPIPHLWGEPVPERSIVVIRSTWDYIEQPSQFATWLDHLDAQRAVVHNPTTILRWNLSKTYLVDLEQLGVAVVPTHVVGRHGDANLHDIIERRGWNHVVIKPAIGGTARLTINSAMSGITEAARHLAVLAEAEDAVVQPYLHSVAIHGETSLVAIAGRPLLAVCKRARPGDWRVQSDFGGTVERVEVSSTLAELAAAVLANVRPAPTYARLDFVVDDHGEYRLLELELVEPELFFRLDHTVADGLAAILATAAG